tara:strand:+ start:472 stop:873 length:402 start_codon:yes stop_codon:yes gene_type:complete
MKKLLFMPFLFLIFISPLNSEIKEKKEYGKYDFYAKCLDYALPKTLNTGLVYECSKKANEKIAALIQEKISSKGDCDKEGFESHACTLERSQKAFKNYYQSECNWNKYGTMYVYCEMMLKKDRLKWLDKTLGT